MTHESIQPKKRRFTTVDSEKNQDLREPCRVTILWGGRSVYC